MFQASETLLSFCKKAPKGSVARAFSEVSEAMFDATGKLLTNRKCGDKAKDVMLTFLECMSFSQWMSGMEAGLLKIF